MATQFSYGFMADGASGITNELPLYKLQEYFEYFVVMDFEATCDKYNVPEPQEIIEFPSVIVNSFTGKIEAKFQTYVRPTFNQALTDFCKDLTGIHQNQVDEGVTLNEAILNHDIWLQNMGIKNTKFAVVTWGDWDCKIALEKECKYKNIRKPLYFNQWINLRIPFTKAHNMGDRCSLSEAIKKAGLYWHGRAHSGLDDAINTAHLVTLLIHKGCKFSITNSLHCPTKMGIYQLEYIPCVPNCYCGIPRCQGMNRQTGPNQGRVFFGCGNWNSPKRCPYFEWAFA